MDQATVITIITSAAVGALASAAVNLIGQGLERKARRRELLLSKAIELAFARRETLLRIAERDDRPYTLHDDVSIAAAYFGELQHLLDRGTLSDEFKKRENSSIDKIQGAG